MNALVHLREVAAVDPAAALRLADEYEAVHGSGGIFSEEREEIRILALARSGRRDDARARGEAFLERNPKSSFAAAVREVTAGGDALHR
jgi:hypothetical protein